MNRLGEEAVTRILSKKEILSHRMALPFEKKQSCLFNNIPRYDLGNFLANLKPESGRFGSKYIFVK